MLMMFALVLLGASNATAQCVSLTSGAGLTYTQDFNTLSNVAGSTTNNLTIPGWFMTETGGGARDNEQYAVDTGSSTTGDTYSYGAAGSTNRALGGLQSGTLIPVFGACFTNNTGAPINSVAIQYTGKQFRVGTINRPDKLDFQYSTNATSLTTGTWVDQDALDYSAPQSATVGAVSPAASSQIGPTSISSLSIANGATFWIRWNDFNATGADDGLAVDDFSLIANGGSSSTSPSATGSATAVSPGGTTTFSGTITAGSNPTSTSYTVSCNLTSVGGSNNFALTVSGTTVSGSYTVPAGTAANNYPLPCTVTDDQSRTGNFNISLTVNAQVVTIMQIQGSGSRSPFENQAVTTSGIVYDVSFNGFWIQDPNGDGDPNTSDGVFVFTSSAPTVHQGDSVSVSGKVSEFSAAGDPSASPQTEISGTPSYSVISTGNPLPTPVSITAANIDPNGGIDQLERYEGMRVHIDTLNVVAPTGGTVDEVNATSSSNGVFFGVIPGLPRPFRKAGIELPAPAPAGAPCCVPFWNGGPQRIRVDTDVIGTALGAGLNLTTGAVVTNLTGPLDFSQHAYTIVTETLPVITTPNISAIPVPAPDLNSEFTVGSFNMERFFDTTDDPNTSDVALTPTAFANRLNKASLAIRNVMRSPDVLGVEEMENLATLQAVATKLNSDTVAAGGTDPQYTAYLVEGNDIGGIDVGFLVKSTRITVNSVTQYGKDTTYIDPTSNQPAILNDRPPLVLTATLTANGNSLPFTAIVVHQRSLSSVDDPVDGPRVRFKRRAQAEYLANLIQSFQAADPNVKIISVGDYNAFEVNDGYVDAMGTVEGNPTPVDQVTLASPDLVDPNLTDLESTLPADQQYSYVTYGTAQTLDHVLVNQGMLGILSRFSYARNDADFPETYRNDPNRPERLSDHDMEVAYFKAPIVAGTVNLLTTAKLTKLGDGSYQATVTVSNRGTGTAVNVRLTQGSLGSANGSPIPQSLGNIAPGGTAVTTVNFPSSAGASGAAVVERYNGSYNGGTFGTSIRATLP